MTDNAQPIKRTTTIVVETEGRSLPQWIMDAHLGKEPIHGVRVRAIATGNLVNSTNRLDELIDEYWDRLPKAMRKAIEGGS